MGSTTIASPTLLPTSFYSRLALIFLAIGVLGFAPTYWLPLLTGTVAFSPLVHLHAALLYSWQLLFLLQTTLIRNRNFDLHRRLGYAAVPLALGMLYVGQAATIDSIHKLDAAGHSAAGRAFSIISFTSIWMFTGFFTAAIYFVRQPQVHKRLLLVASIGILNAPIGRLFRFAVFPNARPDEILPPPPMVATLPIAIVVDSFLLLAILHDRRTRGSVHPAYWCIAAIILSVHILRVPFSQTQAWRQLVQWLAGSAS